VKVVLGLCNKWYSVGSIDLQRFFLYVPLVFIIAPVAAEPFEASCSKSNRCAAFGGETEGPRSRWGWGKTRDSAAWFDPSPLGDRGAGTWEEAAFCFAHEQATRTDQRA
jgi:hypothetical protein